VILPKVTIMANWFEMLKDIMEEDGENFTTRNCTMNEKELKKEFHDGYGTIEGEPFTAWGENWVYFPVCYDGAEWVGHAPRNPCNIKMDHQGGY
jgi:hypothetical protein